MNMPDSLQSSPSGELLEQRAQECEDKACEIEGYADEAEVNWDNREEDNENGEKGEQEIADEILDELESNIDFSIS